MAPGLISESEDEALLSSLMSRSQDGDREAYRMLLGKIHLIVLPYIRNQLRRFSHADAELSEDVAQEVLLAVHSRRHTYDPTQYFLPWVYAIARYKLIDHLRALRRTRPELVMDAEELAETPSNGGVETEAPELATLVARLPPKQQALLEMVKIRGLSVREAAREYGASESDVKVSVHRALKALKTLWRNDEN